MRYYTTVHNYSTVHVVEAKGPEYTLTVMGEPYGPNVKKLHNQFHDEELEAQGYRRLAVINGGLFFSEGDITYAEGIEKCSGVVHETDDDRLDTCMGIGVNTLPYVWTQSYLKANLDKFRGAVTGAFGLLNNGLTDTRGRVQRSSIYWAKSGRSIVGKKPDGTIVLASVYGVTGRSGLTGPQTVDLARKLGCTNAVCMDGGGSVGMVLGDVWKVRSYRPIKNAIGLYSK